MAGELDLRSKEFRSCHQRCSSPLPGLHCRSFLPHCHRYGTAQRADRRRSVPDGRKRCHTVIVESVCTLGCLLTQDRVCDYWNHGADCFSSRAKREGFSPKSLPSLLERDREQFVDDLGEVGVFSWLLSVRAGHRGRARRTTNLPLWVHVQYVRSSIATNSLCDKRTIPKINRSGCSLVRHTISIRNKENVSPPEWDIGPRIFKRHRA
jgi:hypothetical protein